MHYVSTRGTAPTLGFAEALLTGLARDGGLYAPLALPEWRPNRSARLRGLRYADAAVRVMSEFIGGDFGSTELEAMTAGAYAGFRHAATAPLVQIEPNLFALELFHGPTLAFKDFAMQWLGRAMNRVLDDAGRAGDHSRRDLRRHRRGGDRGFRRTGPDRRLSFSTRTDACRMSSADR